MTSVIRRDEKVEEEFSGAALGDARRTRRAQLIAKRAVENPGAGLPQMAASAAELEGMYRLLNSEHITFDALLAPHIDATLERAREVGHCLIVHDTTLFEFPGESHREGLGRTPGKRQGFASHVALALMPGEARVPLGVCGVINQRRLVSKNSRSRSWYDMSKDPERESLRWQRLLEEIEDRKQGFSCIHLMDREGDIYDLLALARRRGARFVIRAAHDRALSDDESRLRARLATVAPLAHRDIELSRRSERGRTPGARERHPSRSTRAATIAVGACVVTLRRTQGAHVPEEEITLHAVRVWEPSPPAGETPVEWMLYTTEPIDSAQAVLAIVDAYRSRWTIEEYFKALKTGCAFEKRQLESFHALSNVLAIFLPVAWKLLLARSLCRAHPEAPARTLLADVQLTLLMHKLKLAEPPTTAEQATYAIARLGGHLRHNGQPGWQTLGRGLEALILMKVGWDAAMNARSDQ